MVKFIGSREITSDELLNYIGFYSGEFLLRVHDNIDRFKRKTKEQLLRENLPLVEDLLRNQDRLFTHYSKRGVTVWRENRLNTDSLKIEIIQWISLLEEFVEEQHQELKYLECRFRQGENS